jgi:DNA-binding XRE family transcriptional regulator
MHAGDLIRQWRQRRRLSQLDLAMAANVSSRHLSFVETGLSFLSITAVIGTPMDITVEELAIESFYPADDQTAAALA